MSTEIDVDYRGLNLSAIAAEIDRTFGFASEWHTEKKSEAGSYEFEGKIVIDLEAIDKLCEVVEVGPGDVGHVLRYVMAHLKTHHYQELNPRYGKPYAEDPRPWELEADLAAGWICANAHIQNAFRILFIAPVFNDMGRLKMMSGQNNDSNQELPIYPWPQEREVAFRKGGRLWANGQLSAYNTAATKQGMIDETFTDFLTDLPITVNNLWNRPVPEGALQAFKEDQERRHSSAVIVEEVGFIA
jgi:hypothetical protein